MPIVDEVSTLQESASSQALLSDISSTLLQAELTKRQDESPKPVCGSGKAKGGYNTSLHVFALILILVLSTAACSFPIIVKRFPKLPIPVPHRFLFLSRHFGTGVLIATAFVHLLPTAFVSLTDRCLPRFWNQGYPAMAGFIAMTSVLIVVGIEMFFATRGAGHVHASEYGAAPMDEGDEVPLAMTNGHARPPRPRRDSLRYFGQQEIGFRDFDSEPPRTPTIKVNPPSSPTSPTSPSFPDVNSYHDSDADPDEGDPNSDTTNLLPSHYPPKQPSAPSPNGDAHCHRPYPSATTITSNNTNLSQHTLDQKLLLQCLLLEAGILFHSIFIGMALSVATGPPFLVLLIAISFHQSFEGLALGSRIAAISSFPPGSPKPWLMALAYGTTTPVGQAIGLAVHRLYDPEGEMGLLMVGVMNAISSGLLLFAGLVELLAEDFLSDKSYEVLRGRKRVEAGVSVVAGGVLMALVGAWA